MAPRTDRTARIPSGVASPVATSHAAKGSVFVDLTNTGNLRKYPWRQVNGRVGMVPANVVRMIHPEKKSAWGMNYTGNGMSNKQLNSYMMMEALDGVGLSLHRQRPCDVVRHAHWRQVNGRVGMVPANFVRIIHPDNIAAQASHQPCTLNPETCTLHPEP